MTNPLYDPYRILQKIYSEGAYLKQAISDCPIEEANRAQTVKIVYGVLENDALFDYCIRQYAPKAPKLPIRTLLKIAMYMLAFLQKHKYMVTDFAVDLCKKLGKGGASGFVNAYLRNFDIQKVPLPEDPLENLSVRYSMPLEFVRVLDKRYGERTESILAAKSSGVTVRFVRDAEKYLERPHTDTPFPNVYIFPNFIRDGGFFMGDYTFQSVGSVAICTVCDPCESLLDACAAPGGKSVLLSEKCGKITACELHTHRVELIESYVSRMGVENVTAVQADSTVFSPAWEGAFDGVLCDVPCSGLGTFAENPDVKRNKTLQDVAELNKTQFSILQNVSRYVKDGGYIVYSTCSVLQSENDGTVQKFLKANPAFRAEAISSPLPHEKTAFGLQFLPDTAFGAGFYVAKLRKG